MEEEKRERLGAIEAKFADRIWEMAPVSSAELVRIGEELFHWKRTTVYTVLKRLCDKGLFENDHGTVHEKISRESYYANQSRRFVEEAFDGSLPAFLAAFAGERGLTEKEVQDIRNMIAAYTETEEK